MMSAGHLCEGEKVEGTMPIGEYKVLVAVRVKGKPELFGFHTEEDAQGFAKECRNMGAEVIIGRPSDQKQ